MSMLESGPVRLEDISRGWRNFSTMHTCVLVMWISWFHSLATFCHFMQVRYGHKVVNKMLIHSPAMLDTAFNIFYWKGMVLSFVYLIFEKYCWVTGGESSLSLRREYQCLFMPSHEGVVFWWIGVSQRPVSCQMTKFSTSSISLPAAVWIEGSEACWDKFFFMPTHITMSCASIQCCLLACVPTMLTSCFTNWSFLLYIATNDVLFASLWTHLKNNACEPLKPTPKQSHRPRTSM